MGKPAEDADAVVNHYHDHAVREGESTPVVDGGTADAVAPPMDPDHHGKARPAARHVLGLEARSMDVEAKAVLATRRLTGLGAVGSAPGPGELDAGRALAKRLEPPLPVNSIHKNGLVALLGPSPVPPD